MSSILYYLVVLLFYSFLSTEFLSYVWERNHIISTQICIHIDIVPYFTYDLFSLSWDFVLLQEGKGMSTKIES